MKIDYYGECQELAECTEDVLSDFPRRMREWLYEVMRSVKQQGQQGRAAMVTLMPLFLWDYIQDPHGEASERAGQRPGQQVGQRRYLEVLRPGQESPRQVRGAASLPRSHSSFAETDPSDCLRLSYATEWSARMRCFRSGLPSPCMNPASPLSSRDNVIRMETTKLPSPNGASAFPSPQVSDAASGPFFPSHSRCFNFHLQMNSKTSVRSSSNSPREALVSVQMS